MGLARQVRADLLNYFFGKGALTPPTTFWIGLSSTLPTPTGTNITEPSGGGYARQQVTIANWNVATAAEPAVLTNAAPINFPAATADWLSGSLLPYAVIMSLASNGVFYGYGEFVVAKAVYNSDVLSIGAGKLQITLG